MDKGISKQINIRQKKWLWKHKELQTDAYSVVAASQGAPVLTGTAVTSSLCTRPLSMCGSRCFTKRVSCWQEKCKESELL